ncbi:MAG: alternative ribosome rescue aminoacyl-tRNA hydrolase ArfB [Candidatus Latescibacterota bacterium]
MEGIEIQEGTLIPGDELEFVASRSSGPGGQNVNKVNTRMTVRFDVRNSPNLTEEQKALIQERLRTRITLEGILQVSSQQYRTQGENRSAAVGRLTALLRSALERKPKRKKTRTPLSAHRERLEEKRHRGQIKKEREKIRNLNSEL